MKFKKIVTCVLAAAVLLSPWSLSWGQESVTMSEWIQLIEKIGTSGSINWSAGYIEAVGIGAPPAKVLGLPQARPMALRAGELVAKRNLLEVTKGVRIDSTTIIKDFTVASDVINSQVEGFIKGAQVVKQEYMSDGTVEVTVRMPLYGNFSQAIMPKILEQRKSEESKPAAPPAAPAKTPAAASVYTGLVIDARGMQTRPAMSPRIIDENAQEIYSAQQVDREQAIQKGMSGYARDLTAAQSNARVTNNPLTIKGLKTQGQGRSDIVISNADAAALRGTGDNLSFLKKCQVMIVLD